MFLNAMKTGEILTLQIALDHISICVLHRNLRLDTLVACIRVISYFNNFLKQSCQFYSEISNHAGVYVPISPFLLTQTMLRLLTSAGALGLSQCIQLFPLPVIPIFLIMCYTCTPSFVFIKTGIQTLRRKKIPLRWQRGDKKNKLQFVKKLSSVFFH